MSADEIEEVDIDALGGSEGEIEKRDTVVDYITGTFVLATPEEVEAVQPFAKRLVEDFGYSKQQIISHPQYRIRRRPSDESKSYPVDLAVFSSEDKSDDDLFMIVECKQPKRSDGQRQLEIYLDLCSATIGVWFNGDEHVYLQKYVTEKGINAYREIPLIPLNGQRIEDIGKFYRRDLKASLNLRSVFKDIRNHIAGHTTGVTRDEAIAGEIINLLFCKIYDEINTAPDEIVKFRYGINEPSTDVAVRIKGLFVDVKKDYRDVFQETDAITLDDKTIAYVVGELQRYCITEAERDVIGEAFEVFIGPALKGSQGQFFTPRNIVRTAIEIVNPSPTDRVLDPACGSGGFLIVALEHVWRKLSAEAEKRGLGRSWLRTREDAVATNNFRGIEKDSFLAKITKAYMAIVGDGRGGIVCENSLLRSSEWPANVQQAIQEDFDVIFTNPPFGAKIMITDYDILKHYDLGHKWKRRKGGGWDKTSQALKKQPPQILFIERCLQLLKPGGTLAIILPDGILGGAKIGYVPHFINEKFETVALVDCPLESFSPNTTTKVHLLVLRKRVITRVQVGRRIFQEKKASPTVKDVFMSVPQIVGHDKKGHTIYLDPKNQIVRDDLEITKARWNEFKAGKKVDDRFGFTIEISELEESLNAKRYLPMFMDVVRRIRKSTMAKKTLGDIALVLRTGANVDNLDYVAAEDGVPYILVKNVLREGIVFSNLKHIKKATAADFGPAIAEENDIIINRCGDTGIAAIVPKDLAGAVVCGFCFRLKVRSGYNPNYIAAFLNSKLGSLQLKRLAIGSILEHITKDDLKTVEIVFPKTDEEIEAIASRFAQSTTYRQLARKEMDDAAKDIVDALAKH